MKNKIFIVLLIFLLAAPASAAANVTYPQEYYTLGGFSNDAYNSIASQKSIFTFDAGGTASIGTFFELRRHTILMEKQNELQAELVKAQWVETCYAPKYYTITGNISAWKSECANAGYPVG